MTDSFYHSLVFSTCSIYQIRPLVCGLNADWNCQTWHISDGAANIDSGEYYILHDDEAEEFLLVRRFSINDHRYQGDGYNDEIRTLASQDLTWTGIVQLIIEYKDKYEMSEKF